MWRLTERERVPSQGGGELRMEWEPGGLFHTGESASAFARRCGTVKATALYAKARAGLVRPGDPAQHPVGSATVRLARSIACCKLYFLRCMLYVACMYAACTGVCAARRSLLEATLTTATPTAPGALTVRCCGRWHAGRGIGLTVSEHTRKRTVMCRPSPDRCRRCRSRPEA